MKVVPYESAWGAPFGSSCQDVSAIFGAPQRISSATAKKRLEYHYPSVIFRFDDQLRLVEATADVEYVDVEGCSMPGAARAEVAFVELGFVIAKLDNASFSTFGFLVSPMFGVAFDPECRHWLTAFAASELSKWQEAA